MVCTVCQRSHVTHCQIHNVDVIPDTCAVRGVVIVAVDLDMIQLAGCHLCHIRHQVVGDAVGVLAQQTAHVCADGVEIPQRHRREVGVSRTDIPQDLFDHHLGIAIGIGRRGGHLLPVRHRVLTAVDRGAGGKDHGAAAVLPHHTQQRQCAAHVVLVVFQRLFHRFAHCLHSGEVYHGVDLVVLKDLFQVCLVPHIRPVKPHVFSGNHLDASDCLDL